MTVVIITIRTNCKNFQPEHFNVFDNKQKNVLKVLKQLFCFSCAIELQTHTILNHLLVPCKMHYLIHALNKFES